MAPAEVLVIFYSRCGSTERLALSAGVGAVQARANVRFRRLADTDENSASESPECRETVSRMLNEYVAPTEADILRAKAIILAARPSSSRMSPEWSPLFAILERLQRESKLQETIAAAISTDHSTSAGFYEELLRIGITTVPPPYRNSGNLATDVDHCVDHGRRVGVLARALTNTTR